MIVTKTNLLDNKELLILLTSLGFPAPGINRICPSFYMCGKESQPQTNLTSMVLCWKD